VATDSRSALQTLLSAHKPGADYLAVLVCRLSDTGTLEFSELLQQDFRTRDLAIWSVQGGAGQDFASDEFQVANGSESLGRYSLDPSAVRRLVAALSLRQGPYAITSEERVGQACRALGWLRRMVVQGSEGARLVPQRSPALREGLQGPSDLQAAVRAFLAAAEAASQQGS